ncbi:MAG: agmatine deiminase family protein [Planctomycetales bacterium]|nr:agmatine deiminase family protein [Planctomycetales bacterium]
MNPDNMLPRELGYRWPAEWEPHRATWLVWPHNPATWPGRFAEARCQFAQFVATAAKYETVELLVRPQDRAEVINALPSLVNVSLHEFATNDSWIRDHGPIFLQGGADRPSVLLDFQYNAWGGKYPPFDRDNLVPAYVADVRGRCRIVSSMILEGGSIEGNGDGTVLTTEPCLLNPNRNPGMSRVEVERNLRDYLAAQHIVWLTGEILGDDTDSHIDQIGRFVNRSHVLLTDVAGSSMFRENRSRLNEFSLRAGIQLTSEPLVAPTPRADDGMWLPASYANFYLVNGAVLVPVFRDSQDDIACRQIEACFPGRRIEPVPADDLIYGLGALHCLSQQEPLAE